MAELLQRTGEVIRANPAVVGYVSTVPPELKVIRKY